jgi:folate-dependent phosphoribosylglycinamide formyltransferase PurN
VSVVILAGRGDSSFAVAHFLAQHFPVEAMVLEEPPSAWQMLRRRARRQGYLRVTGQVLFILYARLLTRRSQARLAEIRAAHGLRTDAGSLHVIPVKSVNDEDTIALLRSLQPRVVVVNGTRIISDKVLRAIGVPFINTHAGITPKYRGVHGAYWALARGDADHAGVTVHLVDPGVDTGAVLYQARISATPADNFATYPTLQLAQGLPLLRRAVEDALAGTLAPVDPGLPSQLHYHPTLWQYVRTWVRSGVK